MSEVLKAQDPVTERQYDLRMALVPTLADPNVQEASLVGIDQPRLRANKGTANPVPAQDTVITSSANTYEVRGILLRFAQPGSYTITVTVIDDVGSYLQLTKQCRQDFTWRAPILVGPDARVEIRIGAPGVAVNYRLLEVPLV